MLSRIYPDGINSIITHEVRDPQQIFYCWVFKCEEDFHSKYYVSPKSGKFYKLNSEIAEQMSFITDSTEKDLKTFKILQDKFNSDFSNLNSLISVVAETSKEKLKELYGSEDINEVLLKQKEKLFDDIIKQNEKTIDFKSHFLENKEISKNEVELVNQKKSI